MIPTKRQLEVPTRTPRNEIIAGWESIAALVRAEIAHGFDHRDDHDRIDHRDHDHHDYDRTTTARGRKERSEK